MILCVSTSSPLASIAGFEPGGALLWSAERQAPRAASQAILELLGDRNLCDVSLVVADVGPGSFTGVRVGVTVVKTWAFALNVKAAAVSSFDLADAEGEAVLPFKRGWVMVRRPGQAISFEPSDRTEFVWPHASRLRVQGLVPVDAEQLMPFYAAEPSISQASQPHIMGETLA